MSWYLAATVNTQPSEDRYIYINNSTTEADWAGAGYEISLLASYTYLDYIIVGGGGGGGGGSTGISTYQGGGGGGSGYLKSTMTHNATNYVNSLTTYVYNITTVTDVGGTIIIPLNTTKISVTLGGAGGAGGGGGNGGGGAATSISIDTVPITTVTGGGGGDGGGGGGQGGSGFNGGGGACGDSSASGGIGNIANGGFAGDNAPSNAQPGTGGGDGGGWDPVAPGNFNQTNENAGGGGGAGSRVKLLFTPPIIPPTFINTGGNGAGCYLGPVPADDITSTGGTDYTGAGGGGGGNNVVASGQEPSAPGGKGYAILYFHN